MNIETYLQRFNAQMPAKIDLEHLTYLQLQHLYHIPFETLDVINKTPIILDLERFYKKVVNNKRGGFCYELNGLFNWLIQELGYQSRLIAATVWNPDQGRWALENAHATLLVTLDQDYLVDVGFGRSVCRPIALTGEEVEDVSGTYRISDSENKEIYFFQRQEEGEWINVYSFSTKGRELHYFTPMCHFNQTSPNSPFTSRALTSIATKTGRITLSGNTLTITEGSTKTNQQISDDQKEEILKEYFGLTGVSLPS